MYFSFLLGKYLGVELLNHGVDMTDRIFQMWPQSIFSPTGSFWHFFFLLYQEVESMSSLLEPG